MNIIIGRTTEIEVPTPEYKWMGIFDVKLIDAKTKHIKRHLRFRNLITNAALDYMGGTGLISDMQNWAGVGTGATAPAATDTTLQTPIGSRIGTGGASFVSGPAFAYWYSRRTFTFLESNANGNLTEIGLFNASSAGVMFTRQLFKDGTGTPTAITKTAADQLQITYEVRLYSPTVDVTGVVSISGVNYNYTVRAANIGDGPTWGYGGGGGGTGPLLGFFAGDMSGIIAYETDVLGSTSGQPGGTGNSQSSMSISGYVAASYQRDGQHLWEPGNANFATGIGSMLFGGASNSFQPAFQVSYSPKIPKTSVKRLTFNSRVSWGRYP